MALGGTVRGKKVTLRLPIEADLDAHQRWVADMRIRRRHSVWHEPAMPATWKEWFAETAKERQTILWSIDAQGRLVGMALAHLSALLAGSDTSVEHLVIDPDEWRKGYGFDAALAMHRYFFDYLDLRRSGIVLRADNAAALRIAERLGYTEYARGHEVYYRDGAYVDEVQLFMEKDTWHERWSAEREYAPLAPEAFR